MKTRTKRLVKASQILNPKKGSASRKSMAVQLKSMRKIKGVKTAAQIHITRASLAGHKARNET